LRIAESVSIGSIFARREDGQYTMSANMYQNILRYSIFLKNNPKPENDNGKSFSYWQLADWLTGSSSKSDKRTKDRIENPQRTIKKKLIALRELELVYVSESKPGVKGIGTSLTYQFTKFGYLLAWIIESFDKDYNEELVQNEIFTLVNDIFTIREHSSAPHIFFSKFVKKCEDRKEFRNIITLFRQGISEGNLIKIRDLFNYIWRFDFEDLQTRIRFNNIFIETLSELDSETQELILYAHKLDIERRMKAVVDNFENYEQARFMLRADYNKVVLEGVCWGDCDRLIYVGIDLRDYRKSVVGSYSEQTRFLSRNCPECNKDSFSIRIV